MISKALEIASGWKNYIFTDPKIEELANLRAKICGGCPKAIPGTWSESLPDKSITEIKGFICSQCNCPLTLKCRSVKTNCPLDKW